MCTLIVLHRCLPGRPLVVAANRDEFLDRPAEDFAVRATGAGPVLCPLDLEAGGTWVGLSRRGVFAGLTNLRPLAADPSDEPAGGAAPKSRGGVVMTALEAESAAAAVRTLSQLEEAAYNPFQLIVADGRDAFLMVYRGRPSVVELEPGPHIVGNVEDERIASKLEWGALLDPSEGPNAGMKELKEAYPGFESVDGLEETIESTDSMEPRALKLTRIRARVEGLVDEPGDDLFEGLARACREHVDEKGIANPFEATCVHVSDRNGERYGTRSSLLLELSEDPGSSRLWTTDGAPCRHPFVNRSSLLKDLGVA